MTHWTHCPKCKKLLSIPELCDQFCETCNKEITPPISDPTSPTEAPKKRAA